MHNSIGSHYFAAKCSSDRLMSEADTQDRDLACEMPDYIDADSRLLRCARPGRDHDPLRVEFLDLLNRGLIVAAHYHLLARLTDVLHQIERKRIVVIENKHHQQNYRAEPPETRLLPFSRQQSKHLRSRNLKSITVETF